VEGVFQGTVVPKIKGVTKFADIALFGLNFRSLLLGHHTLLVSLLLIPTSMAGNK
jgi:hypothetical protein